MPHHVHAGVERSIHVDIELIPEKKRFRWADLHFLKRILKNKPMRLTPAHLG